MVLLWYLIFLNVFTCKARVTTYYCCQYLSNPAILIQCVNEVVGTITCTGNFSSDSAQSIIYATFISPEVYSYAGKNVITNLEYFQSRGIGFKVLSSETGDDHYPQDKRWNKVPAVANALRSWARNFSYVVFIDADLVILNPEFDVARVISEYSSAHLIVAADQIDIANTGFMIVKNSPWSIGFFDKWWAARDMKDTFCDQHVLNKLLEDPDDRSLVAVIPAKRINSIWPAIDNYQPHDPILHLMGETHEVRDAVADYLAREVCATKISAVCRKEKLVEIKRTTEMQVWERSKAQCLSVTATETDFDVLQASLGQRCDPSKRHKEDNDMCEKMLGEAMTLHNLKLQAVLEELDVLERDSQRQRSSQLLLAQRVLHLNHLSMLHFDLLELTHARCDPSAPGKSTGTGTIEQVYAAAQQSLTSLEALQAGLDMAETHNAAYIHHKRGLIFALLSQLHQRHQHWDHAIENDMICISELSAALQVITAEQGEFPGFVLSYIHATSRLAESYRQHLRLSEAAEWVNIALTNAQLLYARTSSEERLRGAELHSVHALCRAIAADLQDTAKVAYHSREIQKLTNMSRT